ncbi:MAG TPA: hypothetical protein VI321_04070 [Burkholderiales bacterium]
MRLSHTCFVLSAGLLVASAAVAANRGDAADARARYQEERARCMQSAEEDQKACLKEAGAALQAERRRQLEGDDTTQAQYERNRLARCAYLPEADRPDCERRMRGEGTVSGSVEGGGIYRELRTIVPADEDSSASGASRR